METLHGVDGDFGFVRTIEESDLEKLLLVFRRKDGAQCSLRRIFIPNEPSYPAKKALWLEEAARIKKLMHRNLVRIDDVWFNEMPQLKICNLLMEQCETDLASVFADSARARAASGEHPLLQCEQGRHHTILDDYCQQMLEGLTYLHARGLVHTDIRLASVFLKEQWGRPVVKLGDPGPAPHRPTRAVCRCCIGGIDDCCAHYFQKIININVTMNIFSSSC